jgi:hypothetical protein
MKEAIMNTADMMIHVHPELDVQARTDLERELEGRIGVDCAEFNLHPHPHSLLVKYDPEAVKGMEILNMVRKLDPDATMVGL